MKAFLLEYLPRLVPGWKHEEHFLLVPHQGKSDLDKSIPKKLGHWREPGVCFVVVRDNDGVDCRVLKGKLCEVCKRFNRVTLIRLVCQELESWYLGDAAALVQTYPQADNALRKLTRDLPDPDACIKPSSVLERLVSTFQKQDAARRFGRLLRYQDNRSASFRVFSLGVEQIARTCNRGGEA